MATRYWVGGTGTWTSSSTTNWAATSGGAAGASAPTSVDDVVFDSLSNVGTTIFTVTVSTGAVCSNLSTTGLDAVMTLAGTALLSVYGSFTLPTTNFTVTHTGGIEFKSTTTAKTITTNGKSLSAVSFTGVGGGWTLGSALTAIGLTISAGSFSTGNFAVTAFQIFSSGTLTRSISFGTSTVTLSSSSGIGFTGTGLTFTAGTSSVVFTSTAGPTLNAVGFTFYNVSYTGATASAIFQIIGPNTFNNLSVTSPSANGVIDVLLYENITVNGTLTLSTVSVTARRVRLGSNLRVTPRTVTVATLGSITNADFKGIAAAGVATPWTGTRLGDGGGNTSITFPAAKTVYWNGAGSAVNWSDSTWALTDGGAVSGNNFPLSQDTAVLPSSTARLTGGATLTIDGNFGLGTLSATTRTVSVILDFAFTYMDIYGGLLLGVGVSFGSGSGAFTFAGWSGTQTLTSAGNTFTQPIYVTTNTATVTLSDAFISSNSIIITSGVFASSGFSLTLEAFRQAISAARGFDDFGPVSVNVSGSAINLGFWEIFSTATYVSGGNFYFTAAFFSSFAFRGGDKTYNILSVGGTATRIDISDNNTFNNIADTRADAFIIAFNAGSTTTVGNFTAGGSAGNLLTIRSITPNVSTHALVKTGGGSISVPYVSVNNSVASPASTWFALDGVDAGGNTGWTFTTTPPTVSSFLLFF